MADSSPVVAPGSTQHEKEKNDHKVARMDTMGKSGDNRTAPRNQSTPASVDTAKLADAIERYADDTDQHGHIGAPGAPPTWMRGPLTAEAQARFAALHASQPETIQRDLKGVMPSALHKCCTIPSAGIHPDVAGAAVDTGAQHPAKNTAAPHAAPHADPEQEIRALQDSVHRRAKAYNELAEKHDEQTAALAQLREGLHATIAAWRAAANPISPWQIDECAKQLAALLAASEGKP